MAATTSTPSLSPPSLSSPSIFFLSPRPHLLRLHRHHHHLSLLSSRRRLYELAVSTVPFQKSPSPELDFAGEISRLYSLRSCLRQSKSLNEKLRTLDSDPRVKKFLQSRRQWVSRVLGGLNAAEMVLVKCLIAVGQEHVLDASEEGGRVEGSALKTAMIVLGDMVERWSSDWVEVQRGTGESEEMGKLLKVLGEIEKFYDCIGGIIG